MHQTWLKLGSAVRSGMRIASVVFCLVGFSGAQTPADSGWKAVEEAMGRPGQMQAGDVIRFGMPRKDLHVMLGDIAIKPGFALGAWAAFAHTENGAMVMGDLVLTEDELGPVMRKLQDGGIEISAVHNHLIGESPHVVYMHIAGHGDAVKLVHAIHDAVALTKTPGAGRRWRARHAGSAGHRPESC